MKHGEIIIYQSADGTSHLDVRLESDTVWLTQDQISKLFGTKRPAITKHLGNIFEAKELDENSVCSILEHTATDSKKYQTKFYNLDVVLSVGYRVNSKEATQFRIWANKVLKSYLIEGYAVNEKIQASQYEKLRNTVQLLANVINHKELSATEATGLLQVITDFAYGLDVLDKYDHQQLIVTDTTSHQLFRATYDTAIEAIGQLKNKFGGGGLFANEKDHSFKSSINTIYQTFDGIDLYSSVEEKAAMLLYLVTKNHSFSDGNKRIAAFLFLWFMEKNGILYHLDGSRKIENNALVALTLMIAESKTEEKDMMVMVVVNLINKNN